MFCKICFDNNSQNFNTHNVKNSHGETICPTLLNYKCPLCFQYGHTPKYCNKKNYDILSDKKYDDKKYDDKKYDDKKNNDKNLQIITSKFSCLTIYDSDHDSDHDSEYDSEHDSDKYDTDNPHDHICHNDINHYGSFKYGIGFDNMIGLKWSDICV